MYRRSSVSRSKCVRCMLVSLIVAMSLATGVGAKGDIQVSGKLNAVVKIATSTNAVQWDSLVPGTNVLPDAFQVAVHCNTRYTLSLHGSSAYLVNGTAKLLNPLEYCLDDAGVYSALSTQPVQVASGTGGTPATSLHSFSLRQLVEFSDGLPDNPNARYTTVMTITASTTLP